MNLRELAHADLGAIIHDDTTGAVSIAITAPDGAQATFKSWHTDIHLSIDPGTGETVTGRQASASVLIADLIAEGFDGIRGEADGTTAPWIVDASDTNGRSACFKVASSAPDNAAGVVVLFLEEYQR